MGIKFTSIYISIPQSIIKEELEAEAEAQKCGHGGVMLTDLMVMFAKSAFPYNWEPLLKGRALHHGMDLPTSIINQDNTPQACLQAHFMAVFS